MHWHIETDVVCLIIMAAMQVDLKKRDFSTMQQDSVFKGITKITTGCIIIDIAASLAMDFATSWWLYQVLNVLYFATLPVLPMTWFYYICTIIFPTFSSKTKKLMGLCMIPGDIFALICLTNPATGLIFDLDKNLSYERGPFFEVAYYMLVFYTIVSFVAVIAKRKRIIPHTRIYLMLSFFIVVGVAVAVQILVPGLLVIYAAYTIVFVITYYYIQNRTAFTDSLTGLYSRATGEQRANDFILKHNGDSVMAFIITDLDHFKTINDTYGHKQGDAVLKAAASACMEAFPNDSVLARLGGDEFLILYTNYSSPEQLQASLASVGSLLREKLLKAAPECAEKATISMGVSLFPEHGSNFMELYENADIALYQGKWSGRNRFVVFSKDKGEFGRDFMGPDDEGANDRADSSLLGAVSPVLREKTMLIIDDSEISRNFLEQIFKDDFFILQAENSVSALRLLRRHGISIDIILLDLMMPGKDGFDFLEEKKDYIPCKNIPVVVVTVSEDEKDHERALQCGATDIILKPVDAEHAKQTIKNVLIHYGQGFSYNDRYQRELLNLANSGMHGGMICVYDEPGHPLEYISLSFVKFLGYDNHHEIFEKNDGRWDNLIYEEDLEHTLETVNKELNHGGEYTELKYRLKHKNGETVWVHDSGKIIRSQTGRDVIVGLCMDVTDTMRLKGN